MSTPGPRKCAKIGIGNAMDTHISYFGWKKILLFSLSNDEMFKHLKFQARDPFKNPLSCPQSEQWQAYALQRHRYHEVCSITTEPTSLKSGPSTFNVETSFNVYLHTHTHTHTHSHLHGSLRLNYCNPKQSTAKSACVESRNEEIGLFPKTISLKNEWMNDEFLDKKKKKITKKLQIQDPPSILRNFCPQCCLIHFLPCTCTQHTWCHCRQHTNDGVIIHSNATLSIVVSLHVNSSVSTHTTHRTLSSYV